MLLHCVALAGVAVVIFDTVIGRAQAWVAGGCTAGRVLVPDAACRTTRRRQPRREFATLALWEYRAHVDSTNRAPDVISGPTGSSLADSALAEKVGHGLQVGTERGRELAHVALDRGAELAEVARERAPVLAEAARERGAEFAELARELGAEWAEVARERAPELADTARSQLKQHRRRWS
jgi:hypothetical protein